MDGDFAQPSVCLTSARNIGGNVRFVNAAQLYKCRRSKSRGKVESDGVSERGAELFCSKSICRVVFGEGGREEEEETLAARACAKSDGMKKRKIWRMTSASASVRPTVRPH